ncbi:MAG: hypothetical protein J1F64_03030 [Oscillospiraceae bacterium]|nr:hypothetical protein [Oscillospiraceae bacterium]
MIRVCVIDDEEYGAEIVRAAFGDKDNVEINEGFSQKADITVYLSSGDNLFRNIKYGSVIIFSENRRIVTDVAVRAVMCGLYDKATVTASSIGISEDKLEFVYCMQRSLSTLEGIPVDIGELRVRSDWLCLEKVLAAVTARIIAFGDIEDRIELIKR